MSQFLFWLSGLCLGGGPAKEGGGLGAIAAGVIAAHGGLKEKKNDV